MSAPVLTLADVSAFRSSAALRNALRRSFHRSLEFYGFAVGEGEIVRAENWDRKAENWWRRFDHNHLRITRIIRCLRVLGLDREAKMFWEALVAAKRKLGGWDAPGETSYMFWRRAARRKIWIAPEEEDEAEEEGEEEEEEQYDGSEVDEEMAEVEVEWEDIESEDDDRTEKGGDEADTDDEGVGDAEAVRRRLSRLRTGRSRKSRSALRPDRKLKRRTRTRKVRPRLTFQRSRLS